MRVLNDVLKARNTENGSYVNLAIMISDHDGADGPQSKGETALNTTPAMLDLMSHFSETQDNTLVDGKLIYQVYTLKPTPNYSAPPEAISRYIQPDVAASNNGPTPYYAPDDMPKKICYGVGAAMFLLAVVCGLYSYAQWFYKQEIILSVVAASAQDELIGAALKILPALKLSQDIVPLGKLKLPLPRWKSPEFHILGTNQTHDIGDGGIGVFFRDIGGQRILAVIDDWAGLEKARLSAASGFLSKEGGLRIEREDLPTGEIGLVNCGYDANHLVPLRFMVDLTTDERLRVRRTAKILALLSVALFIAGTVLFAIGPSQVKAPPSQQGAPQDRNDLCSG